MDVLLVMFKSDGARRDFQITKERVILGRKTDCDLRIPLSSVSRHHCELILNEDDEQLTLRDLGSSNGTYHNNVRVEQATLAPGDEIMVGPVVFIVVIEGQPEQIEPVHTVISESDRSSADGNDGHDGQNVFGNDDADDSGQTIPPLAEAGSHKSDNDFDDDDAIQALQNMSENDPDDSDMGYFPTGEEEKDDEQPERRT